MEQATHCRLFQSRCKSCALTMNQRILLLSCVLSCLSLTPDQSWVIFLAEHVKNTTQVNQAFGYL